MPTVGHGGTAVEWAALGGNARRHNEETVEEQTSMNTEETTVFGASANVRPEQETISRRTDMAWFCLGVTA